MTIRRRHALQALGAFTLPASLKAQPRFPSRAITLIVPFAPGGIADLTARSVAQAMAASLGQPIVVGWATPDEWRNARARIPLYF